MALESLAMPRLPHFQIWSIEPAALQRVPQYPQQEHRHNEQQTCPHEEDVDYISPEEVKEIEEQDRKARVRVVNWIEALPQHPSMFDTQVTQELLLEKPRKRSRDAFEEDTSSGLVQTQQTQNYIPYAPTQRASTRVPINAKRPKLVPWPEQVVMIDLTADDATQETRTDDQAQTPSSYQEAGITSTQLTLPPLHDYHMPSKHIEPSIDEVHFMSLLNDEIWATNWSTG